MSGGIYNKYTGYHNRRSTRLRGYDYSQPGYYFVTVCIHDRTQRLFGDISIGAGSKPAPNNETANGNPGSKPAPTIVIPYFYPNQYGRMVRNTWNDLPCHIPDIELDEFIIMPDHIHCVVRILEHRAGLEPAPTVLPEIVRQLKTFSARRINRHRGTIGQPVWQRNYYEHIIRDEKSLFQIRKYIQENPVNWGNDHENHINKEILKFEMSENGDAI